MTITEKDIKRFFNYVAIIPEHQCWEWTGAKFHRGYGQFRFCKEGKPYTKSAHRTSYRIHFGEIPDEKLVLHKCDNRGCVRPEHLYLGTQSDNMKDKFIRGRVDFRGEGHPATNLTWNIIREIRRMHKSEKFNQRQIAKKFNLGFKHVWGIVHNKIWIE